MGHVDPYGWEGPDRDPWSIDPRGTESIWLWQDGEAPPLYKEVVLGAQPEPENAGSPLLGFDGLVGVTLCIRARISS